MKRALRCPVTAWLLSLSIPALGEQSARELLDRARDSLASASAIRRVDTTEQSGVVIVGPRRMEQKPQTNTVTIEIDASKHLARQTGKIQGQEFIILKQGEKAAMQLGNGRWEIPTGPFENIAKDMGNLFVCEIETPETKKNAPTWKLAGTEMLCGIEAFVIETEGNTAVPLAQERVMKGMAKGYAGNPGQRPTVKVLEYSARHWINKSDYRPLQAVQVSKVEVTMVLPDGNRQLIESSSKVTSRYSYDKVIIEVPEDARKVLSLKTIPSQRGEQLEKGRATTDK